MEVHLSPDVQAKLEEMAREAGVEASDIIEDLIVALYEELTLTREVLLSPHDVTEGAPMDDIDGQQVYQQLMEKVQARRQRRPD